MEPSEIGLLFWDVPPASRTSNGLAAFDIMVGTPDGWSSLTYVFERGGVTIDR